MGIPFTIGMRDLAPDHLQRAYAWAINGCASVLLSIVSAQLALSLGFRSILIGAAIAYAMAYGCQHVIQWKKDLIQERLPQ